ncbi:MAG: cobalt-precorrin-5B (C(1))-methyltransferase CbiD [Romboutsia sp.]
MEEYVYIDGKKYKRGYTTGSCAAAASKAAVYMLITQNKINKINIDTPKGIPLNLDVKNIEIYSGYSQCAIEKDGGDDIDATHTMDIFAKAEFIDRDRDEDIIVCGGIGVGIVTKKGLSVDIGKSAINPVPMKMIHREVRNIIGDNFKENIGKNKSLKITIFAPKGEEIAKKTFNPRLGIVGGISILGTTGIVEPMSDEGWKKSLSIELEMKKAQGLDEIILVPGNHGEEFVRINLGLDMKYVVRTSNFIGYMLKEAQRIGFKRILMAGHIGKYIKISAGIFNTHSKVADARSEILIANLAMMEAPYEILEKVSNCVTTDGAIDYINENGYMDVYNIISNKCRQKINQYLLDEDIEVGVMIFSMDKTLLGKSDNIDSVLEVFR